MHYSRLMFKCVVNTSQHNRMAEWVPLSETQALRITIAIHVATCIAIRIIIATDNTDL